MESYFGQLEGKIKITVDRLFTIFEYARYFSVVVDNGLQYKNHLNDIKLSEKGNCFYLIDEEEELNPFEGNTVEAWVAEDFDGYGVLGKNFLMRIYE